MFIRATPRHRADHPHAVKAIAFSQGSDLYGRTRAGTPRRARACAAWPIEEARDQINAWMELPSLVILGEPHDNWSILGKRLVAGQNHE